MNPGYVVVITRVFLPIFALKHREKFKRLDELPLQALATLHPLRPDALRLASLALLKTPALARLGQQTHESFDS